MPAEQTSVATRQDHTPAPVEQEISRVLPTVVHLLPPDLGVDKFRAALWLEMQRRPALAAECIPESVIECVVKAATHGLLPTRDCHFLPFRNKKKGGRKEATFVPNYQGLQRSLDRTGKVAKSFAHPVHKKDHYEIDYLADEFSHKPARGDRGKVICYYGCIIMKNGVKHVQEMSLDQIDAIKRRSPAHDSGPWVTDYDAMARKTALKQVAKYCNLTEDVQQLVSDDDARERTDIPQARIDAHIDDMFGEDENPTAPPTPEIDTVTGEIESEPVPLRADLMTAINQYCLDHKANKKMLHTWLTSQWPSRIQINQCTEMELVQILAHLTEHGATALTRDFQTDAEPQLLDAEPSEAMKRAKEVS